MHYPSEARTISKIPKVECICLLLYDVTKAYLLPCVLGFSSNGRFPYYWADSYTQHNIVNKTLNMQGTT